MEVLVQDTSLTAVANAIRNKARITNALKFPNDFISKISSINPGVVDLNSGTFVYTGAGGYQMIINHGLSVTPNVVFCVVEDNPLQTINYREKLVYAFLLKKDLPTNPDVPGDADGLYITKSFDYTGIGFLSNDVYTRNYFIDDSKFGISAAGFFELQPGKTYRWVAACVENI